MSVTPLVIIGAGGFGREALDVVEAINAAGGSDRWGGPFEFLGFVDDGHPDTEVLARRAAPFLGPREVMLNQPPATQYVIGVGDPGLRHELDEYLTSRGLRAAVLVHPAATVGGDVEFEDGTIACSHVSVTTNVRTGRHVHLNLNCTVGHDCRLGGYVTVNPGATVSGAVTLGVAVTIGTGAAVLQGLSVGEGTMVGAGAVVVRDLPAGVTAVGVPARAI